MTTLVTVYDALRAIEATSGRKKKEQMLAGALTNPLFAAVCIYAYDPFRRFGVVPELTDPVGPADTDLDTDAFFDLLDALHARKLTGGAARAAVDAYLAANADQGRLLIHVLNKDLRAGFGVSTLNRVQKGFVRVFETMLAHKYRKDRILDWSKGVAGQEKCDGYRGIAKIDRTHNTVTFFTREGHEYPAKLPLIEDEILALDLGDHTVLDGELKVIGNFGANGKLRRKGAVLDDVHFRVFELLTDAEFQEGSTRNHVERRATLEKHISFDGEFVSPIEERILFSHEEIMQWFGEILAAGGEGLVIKPLHGLYEPTRSYNWLKVKNEIEADLECIGVLPPKPGTKDPIGGLLCLLDDVEVKVAGLTKKFMEMVAADPACVIGKIVHVKCHEPTEDGSLRHPRLGPKGIRHDKSEPDTFEIVHGRAKEKFAE